MIFFPIFFLFFGQVWSIYDGNSEGHPAGFISKCPESDIPIRINRDELKYLKFVLQNNIGLRKTYNYWNAVKITKNKHFDPNRKTMIFIPGYLDSPYLSRSLIIGQLYTNLGYNVVLIGYQYFATQPYYITVRLLPHLTYHIAEVLTELSKNGLDLNKTEFVGYSLGAHVAGLTGKHLKLLTNTSIGRIVGLDPAGPCYRYSNSTQILFKTDAKYVEVYHTNIDSYGMARPVGHVDVYVNGGEYQPEGVFGVPCSVLCSHFRILGIWVSILLNPGKFSATKCQNVQQARLSKCFGPKVNNVIHSDNTKLRGIFYLETTGQYPFYL